MTSKQDNLARDAIVFDTASKRVKDKVNGYLRVYDSPFTRVQVAEYRGYEIIDWKKAGLKADHIYKVYRPASELSRPETVASLNNIPLLLDHVAYDVDAPPKSRQIGSAGTDAKWDDPYLRNSLIFTDSKAIELLESGEMKELSLGYFYTPVFEPGKTDDGEAYDVIMTDIIANHIALVEEGRAGPDVAVHDSAVNVSTTPKENPMENNPEQEFMAALAKLMNAYNAAKNSGGLPGMDEDPVQASDEDTEEAGVDPAAPELAYAGPDDDDQTQDSEDELASDNDDQAQDSDDDMATDDDDQAQDSEDDLATDDDDQAQDSDDELASDNDDQAQDSDDDMATDDELDEAAAAALEANGLSDAPEEVKAAFLKGMAMGVKKANSMASDSKRGTMQKVISRMVNTAVNKRVNAAMKKERSKAIAMDRCRPYLGRCKATAFDSAGSVYRQALLATGKYSAKETGRLSDTEAASAFNAFTRGRKGAMAKDSRKAAALSERRDRVQAQANAVFKKYAGR